MKPSASHAEIISSTLLAAFTQIRLTVNQRAGKEVLHKQDFYDFFSRDTIEKLLRPRRVMSDDVRAALHRLLRRPPWHEESIAYAPGSRHATQKLIHEYGRRWGFKVKTKKAGGSIIAWKLPREKNVAVASSPETSTGVSISGASSSR